MGAYQRHKASRGQSGFLHKPALLLSEYGDDFLASGAKRVDDPAALCQLLDERLRNFGSCGRDNDAVKRRLLREPLSPVADHNR